MSAVLTNVIHYVMGDSPETPCSKCNSTHLAFGTSVDDVLYCDSCFNVVYAGYSNCKARGCSEWSNALQEGLCGIHYTERLNEMDSTPTSLKVEDYRIVE